MSNKQQSKAEENKLAYDIQKDLETSIPALKKVRKPVKEEIVREIVETSLHMGPLPAPEQLEHYERVCPGIAKEILNMAIAEQAHVHNAEAQLLEIDKYNSVQSYKINSRGQLFALIICLSALAFAAYMAHLGHITTALITFLCELVGVASAYIIGQRKKSDVPKEK